METKRSFRDDVLTSAIAFGTGSVIGVPVAWLGGTLMYLIAENSCSGQYMCGLGAFIWAVLAGVVVGTLIFAVVATSSLRKRCPAGGRLRPGLLTFLGAPLLLAGLFALAGLG